MKRFKQTVKYLFYKTNNLFHNFFRSFFAALAAKKCDYGRIQHNGQVLFLK
jgi:hypothetical protein